MHLAVRYAPDTNNKCAMHGVSVHAHIDACRRHAPADTILLIVIQILQTKFHLIYVSFFIHVSSYILDPKDPKDLKDSSYTHQTILLMQLHPL